jgi:hypothetical protein
LKQQQFIVSPKQATTKHAIIQNKELTNQVNLFIHFKFWLSTIGDFGNDIEKHWRNHYVLNVVWWHYRTLIITLTIQE